MAGTKQVVCSANLGSMPGYPALRQEPDLGFWNCSQKNECWNFCFGLNNQEKNLALGLMKRCQNQSVCCNTDNTGGF